MFSPKVLVLDEPTVGLDPVSTTVFKDKVRKERGEGRTVLLSSHLVNEVEEIADHIVYLVDGRPFFDGTVEELKGRTSEARLDRALVRIMEDASETRA
jgi:Cu-processing system ATP-binding protein